MKTTMRLYTRIVTMMPEHILDILDIERQLFRHSDAWTEQIIRHHWSGNNTGYVAIYQGDICGYVFVECSEDHLRISNIGVSPKHQRYGVGSELIERVKLKLKDRGARKFIAVTVPEDDLGLSLFWRENGFFAWKVDRGLYGPDCDGIEMEWWK